MECMLRRRMGGGGTSLTIKLTITGNLYAANVKINNTTYSSNVNTTLTVESGATITFTFSRTYEGHIYENNKQIHSKNYNSNTGNTYNYTVTKNCTITGTYNYSDWEIITFNITTS